MKLISTTRERVEIKSNQKVMVPMRCWRNGLFAVEVIVWLVIVV